MNGKQTASRLTKLVTLGFRATGARRWRGACSLTAALVLLTGLSGCVVNPVTGERELGLVGAAQEIAIGRAQYVPAQQMQGGAYSTDVELSAYVNRVGQRLAAASGVDLPYEFVVLNNSTPNAWALPGGKIAINRGLLAELRNEAELAAVLGHEIAHAAARHGAKRIERGYAAQAVLIGVAVGSSGSRYAAQAVGGTQILAGLLNQTYSRNAEREADFYGTKFMAKAGYDPYAAVTLQETFVRLAGQRQSNWLEGLFASHPPSTERVSNNRQLLKQLRAEGFTGGELNQPAYAAAMTPLTRYADAYEAFDEAQALYQQDDYDAALQKVNAALSQRPEEAQFHGLRGAIRYQQGRYDDAVTNLDRAIERDSGYFFYYLSRGLALRQQRDIGRAQLDLEKSVQLLPTAIAYQNLGEMAEARGDTAQARAYYEQASDGSSAEATAARSALVRLELPESPGKYISVQVGRNDDGRLVARAVNRADVAIAGVVVRVDMQTAQGTVSRNVEVGALAAGGSKLVQIPVDAAQVAASRGYAISARLAQ